MKFQTAFALSALLAGAGYGWAQDAATTQQNTNAVVSPSSRTGLFGDAQKARRGGAVEEFVDSRLLPASTVIVGGEQAQANCAQPATCMDGGCDTGRPYRIYGSGEWLLWRIGSSLDDSGTANLPNVPTRVPFVFRARGLIFPAADQPGDPIVTNPNPGVVNIYGLADISPILFAGSNLDSNDRNGLRLNVGYRLSDCCAIEATWFQLEQRTQSFRAVAASNVLFENTGLTDIQIQSEVDGVRPPPLSDPAIFSPVFTEDIVGQTSNKLWGLELNARGFCCRIGGCRLEALVGFRFLEFDEDQFLFQQLGVQELLHVGSIDGGGDFIPSAINYTNLITALSARNRFYGAQVGLFGEYNLHGLFANAAAKLAFGGMHQQYDYVQDVFTGSSLPGAILPTMPNNVFPYPTTFSEDRVRLAYIPEFIFQVGYEFTDCCRAWVGYNILYIRRAVRPVGGGLPVSGDGTITVSGETTAALGPAVTNFTETNVVVRGLTLGLEFRY